ncbi:hypothetical protein M3B43_12190 [Nesterenkonia massiliensis]|uniref:Uncharacterized protein n=1 Tax=Nesterenkonia massiliensis TaxID=1232429 RepID=A0ABT2HTN4_9MICC|nr:hypothetical protein [Nesterenkonia massiliensis]MCT1608052.1 hypothetical protein [Nesterenkonia massiliensis]
MVNTRTPGTYRFGRDPWGQAVVSGALSIIPARNYPRWLRRGIIVAPAIALPAFSAWVATSPSAQQKIAAWAGEDSSSVGGAVDNEPADAEPVAPEGPAEAESASRALTPVSFGALLAVTVPLGAVTSAMMAAGFWADEKIEAGLRQLKVPFPRLVMGWGAGALTWWMVKQEVAQEENQALEAQKTSTEK